MNIEELQDKINKMTIELEKMKEDAKEHEEDKEHIKESITELKEFIVAIDKAADLCEYIEIYDKKTKTKKPLYNDTTANRIRKYRDKATNKLNILSNQI